MRFCKLPALGSSVLAAGLGPWFAFGNQLVCSAEVQWRYGGVADSRPAHQALMFGHVWPVDQWHAFDRSG
jgi:hypothetical protein